MESLYGDGRVREMEFLRNLKRDRKKINTGEKKVQSWIVQKL
tara:strand:+ start:136 stop:261 length:126 start_codon:yes stop_codon:yes gene_type:complete